MASSKESIIARRYANALFELCKDNAQQDIISRDFAALLQVLDDSQDLRRLLSNPIVNRKLVEDVMGLLLEKLNCDELTVHFIKYLCVNRRLTNVRAIIERFEDKIADSRGIIRAEITSAFLFDDKTKKQTADSLTSVLGDKLDIAYKVNPEILGGIIIRFASKMIDASVGTQLKKIELSMKGN